MRIIEQGPVRTTAEAIFTYRRSTAVVRYTLDAAETAFRMEIRLYWAEPDKMVKLALGSGFPGAACLGQTMFGQEALPGDGTENVAQQWVAVAGDERAVTVINTGSYASSFSEDELRLTLLRSPAYCAHPIPERDILPAGRFLPRSDIGEHLFRFVINGGDAASRMEQISREAQAENEPPYALSYFPGGGEPQKPFLLLENSAVLLTSLKKHPDGWLLRLFNPTEQPQSTVLRISRFDLDECVALEPFEVRAYVIQGNRLKAYSLEGFLMLESFE